MEMVRIHPPRIAAALALGATGLHFLMAWHPLHAPVPLAAALTAVTGGALVTWAWWEFRKGGHEISPTGTTERITERGPYAYSRNPMYLGITTLLLGLALAVGTPPFYLAALAFWAIMDRVFCRYEETKMAASVGDAYAAYRARVRRWL